MTDYSQMSDFQINAAVFEALHGGSPDFKEGDNGAMVILSFEGDIVDGNAVEIEIERGAFNPCNNPSDAWPIIVGNKISFLWNSENYSAWTGEFPDSESSNEKPLRAAMIAFLKAKDAENANPI